MNIKTLILICLSCLFFTLPAQAQRFAQPVVSFQLVYDELSKHGVWLQDKGLGYVWLPFENGNFRPYYTNGYWAMTEYGQSWISYYSWGWAAFHYGRWTYDGYYGWLWVPGSEWGPAWVKWRYNNEMYGWAPLLPGEHADSILEHTPEDWWVFIDKHDLYNARTTTKYNATENDRMLKGTYSLNNKLKNEYSETVYVTGPTAEEVCRVTDGIICEETEQNVLVHAMRYLDAPAQTSVRNCIIYIYRPQIDETKAAVPVNAVSVPRAIGRPAAIGDPVKRPPFRDKKEMQEGMMKDR